MYKNQLQELAQRSCFNLPSYTCIREGPDHAPRFKAIVNFNGEAFESPNYCSTLRQAEHSAAEAALNSLSSSGPSHSLAARILVRFISSFIFISGLVKNGRDSIFPFLLMCAFPVLDLNAFSFLAHVVALEKPGPLTCAVLFTGNANLRLSVSMSTVRLLTHRSSWWPLSLML